MKRTVQFRTTQGRRPENEDFCWGLVFSPAKGCVHAALVVADGMGGALGGAHASRRAALLLRDRLRDRPPRREELEPWLGDAFEEAHEALLRESEANPSLRGMGTTLVVVFATEDEWVVAHVGDSRAYLLAEGRIEPLTTDHSAVQDAIDRGLYTASEAATNPVVRTLASALTRHLGESGKPSPDIRRVPLAPNSLVLACTDGLTGNPVEGIVAPDELVQHLRGTRDLSDALRNLLSLAYTKGSTDNITVGVVEAGRLPRAKPSVGRLPDVEALRKEEGVAGEGNAGRGLSRGRRVLVTLLSLFLVAGIGGIGWLLFRRPPDRVPDDVVETTETETVEDSTAFSPPRTQRGGDPPQAPVSATAPRAEREAHADREARDVRPERTRDERPPERVVAVEPPAPETPVSPSEVAVPSPSPEPIEIRWLGPVEPGGDVKGTPARPGEIVRLRRYQSLAFEVAGRVPARTEWVARYRARNKPWSEQRKLVCSKEQEPWVVKQIAALDSGDYEIQILLVTDSDTVRSDLLRVRVSAGP
ncbi:MAG: protein phosphatase 2C domain-containing protein [Candidatus Eisenbacteria bacterium]|nr:protein phosphatase 2C domain-containing protein [Candidatus Eisenbacteria bacterium]